VIIAELAEEKLTAAAMADEGTVRARIEGTASQRDVVPLDTFLGAVHAACGGGVVAQVVLDLRSLEYVSSSHLKVMVSWIAKMRALPSRVGVKLLANEKYHWQKRGLPALAHLAEDLVTIDPG
jgi:hypothetical protein